jgi:serine/threonine protein phosphatase 1
MIKHFEINTKGRDFVDGDIHGCFTQLKEKLLEIGFNSKSDRLFSVGDLIDRGNESEECVKWLNKSCFHAVRGNHEQMLIDVVNGDYDAYGYIQNGGSWFLFLTETEQKNFAVLFDTFPIAIEIETKNGLVGIVHADCQANDWNKLESLLTGERKEEIKECCLRDRTRAEQNITTIVDNVHKIYVGHTPVKEITALGNVIYIDTGCVFGHELTVVEI